MNDLGTPPAEQQPLATGAAHEGGFYVGCIRLNGKTYGIIVAPKIGGEIESAWDPQRRNVPGAAVMNLSFYDGAMNTDAMADAGIELAKWAKGLDLGGHRDWYIPSRDELELCYRSLKPTAEENFCLSGENPSSVPPDYAYSRTHPAQTSAEAFRTGGSEAFEEAWYWSSTQSAGNSGYAWYQYFVYGLQNDYDKKYEGRCRAVRRLLVI